MFRIIHPMKHPARTLRALIEDLPEARRFLNRREEKQRDLIRAAGTRFFALLGHDSFTIPILAKALWMSPAAFNIHYCDLESLLADLIRTHLMNLFKALGTVPSDAPDRAAARRAAYLQATRTPLGGLTETHLLLVNRRENLPPDLREPIEELRASLGRNLAGDDADLAFRLLDAPELSPTEIETTLTGIIAAREARHAKHQPAPQAPTPELPPAELPDRRVSVSPPPPDPPPPPPELLTLTRSLANMAKPDWPGSAQPSPPRRPRQNGPPAELATLCDAALDRLRSQVEDWVDRAGPPKPPV
jgi:AcrR family transcriptional regulator